ncbi:UbiA family prenyltransferase [Pseudazoarcus pumilus]|uniref:UbiA family prenyltransferase n=1 Tax=Pseudazoarcus pumilus TaxID=2067960 RepID=A0A2I6S516_9RHOO|nr:UbiA family prenyltransferase [Pseudazoarcus pumilus]AUN94350.1 hypothetical protein C0099_04990 [Pseudazoarcus pumilus]
MSSKSVPLVIDLDGTLLRTDLLIESGLSFVRDNPARALAPLMWLRHGKAALKERLAAETDVDPSVLPYESEVLALIDAARRDGRRVVLATASHARLAQAVAEHLDCFDEVLATRDGENLSAHRKRDRLVERFGERGFDYAGNGTADLPVWAAARQAYVVNARGGVERRAHDAGNVAGVIAPRVPRAADWIAALRLHQWAKNLLLFVPLITSHQFADPALLGQALLAFVLFGLCASSVYLLNDLLDLGDDRHHRSKRLRPFAAGRLPVEAGVIASPALLVLAFGIAMLTLPWAFVGVLAAYYSLTLAYSLRLKRIVAVDVIVLAALYTLRIVAGAAALGIALTFWILAFSMFVFLSLALLKRYTELRDAREDGCTEKTRGRDYHPDDLEMIAPLGAAAGYLAVLVLALYINEPTTAAQYAQPELIWFACPLLLFWITRVWMLAHRGAVHDDPVLFALRDRSSLIVGVLFAAVFWIAA